MKSINCWLFTKSVFPVLAQSHGIKHKMDLRNLSLKMIAEFPNTRAKGRKKESKLRQLLFSINDSFLIDSIY